MNGALRNATALCAGAIFGFGLALSGMLDPVRVRGFLDVAGNWDPSLAFVLGGAVSVSGAAYALSRRIRKPLFDSGFHLPQQTIIDVRLLIGAAVFGVGWGIGGLCPGPAIASLLLGLPPTVAFAAAMIIGILLHDKIWNPKPVRALDFP